VTKAFVLAGKATFTVALPNNGGHFTYHVWRSDPEPGSKYTSPAWFASLLKHSGAKRGTYIGMVSAGDGTVRTTAKSKLKPTDLPFQMLVRVLARVWKDEQVVILEKGYGLDHAGKCCRCGKELTEPTSLEVGIGPECRKLMGIDVKATSKANPTTLPTPQADPDQRSVFHSDLWFDAGHWPAELTYGGHQWKRGPQVCDAEGDLQSVTYWRHNGKALTVFND
jgi:hypothetical protein